MRLLDLLFPPKCVLCCKILEPKQQDFCPDCMQIPEEFHPGKKQISFVAHWTALWYYKGSVRDSLLRYKFQRRVSYVRTYCRFLSAHLVREEMTNVDLVSWVPISRQRLRRRGYDQAKLLAKAVAKELGLPCYRTLRKFRHTPAQSTLADASRRKANVLGAYKPKNPHKWAGKRILLFDDIVTTGATASECARTLLTAGAKEISLAAVAATSYDKR